MGVTDRALDQAQQAVDLATRVGSRVHAGAAQRVLAEVAAARGEPRAEELFHAAIASLTELKSDLELARCYRAFAAFREKGGHDADAVHLRMKADEIFGRLRGAARTPTAPIFTP